MVKYESQCLDCPSMGLPCKGRGCPNYEPIPVHYCDNPKCECELDEIYEVEGKEFCEECLKDQFRKD